MFRYIEVAGYKSISASQRLEFAGLTVLAGSNSSGKSAIMQPILLWKQTVECSYDPGAILLDGPNIKVTASDQIISRIKNKDLEVPGSFMINVGVRKCDLRVIYRKMKGGSFKIDSQTVRMDKVDPIRLSEGMALTDFQINTLSSGQNAIIPREIMGGFNKERFAFKAVRERCFLRAGAFAKNGDGEFQHIGLSLDITGGLLNSVKRMIHVPGLRGNPERTYRATEVSNQFPGTYENYVASIIKMWQESGNDKLASLGDKLKFLGLTWKVMAKRVEDTRVELRVGRMPQATRGGASDLVSLADVGLGVAQVLPILVALLSATKNQVVYIEQPELHLHPRAQWRLAEIVRDAVNKGVRVIIETHSSIFLRGIQTQIAKNNLKGSEVRLNWFTRNIDGNTVISTCTPDSNGALGDWPSDFDDVSMSAESAYLDAVIGPNQSMDLIK